MGWFTTGAVEEFLAEAGPFLRAEPVPNTVILSVTDTLRRQAEPARTRSGSDQPSFGWWQPGPVSNAVPITASAAVAGAFMHTPGLPVVLTAMSRDAASALAAVLVAAGRRVPGVNAEPQAAEAFAAAWRWRTGESAAVHLRTRLFRLGALSPPDPAPRGTARVAGPRDRDLLIEWSAAFTAEIGDPPGQDHAAAVDDKLSHGGIMIWSVAGAPASIAAVTRVVTRTARVSSVYTPPALRGRGYAGAATAAATQAALEAGAAEVVLYTDLANPTSNALYQRLGYRPVEDRLVLSFAPAAPEPP
jgi:ribosomal protein S18 acetylase RimI-like enzyme